jgi:pre-mRNA-processing factor 19
MERTAVPEMIHRLKEDWDTVALETNALKQHIFKLRKELSHALYQQDASCRVISRLLKERDDARK